jgi:hypothetical protein
MRLKSIGRTLAQQRFADTDSESTVQEVTGSARKKAN